MLGDMRVSMKAASLRANGGVIPKDDPDADAIKAKWNEMDSKQQVSAAKSQQKMKELEEKVKTGKATWTEDLIHKLGRMPQ